MGNLIPIRQAPATHVEPSDGQRPRRQPLWRDLVGAFLRQQRTEQKRILADVASAAGVSTQYLSEIERGRKEPSSEILGAVAEALGLGLHDVAAGVGALIEREHAERMRRMHSLRNLRSSLAPHTPTQAHAPVSPDAPAAPLSLDEPELPDAPDRTAPTAPAAPAAPVRSPEMLSVSSVPGVVLAA